MDILFVTKNSHKFDEAQNILKKYGINLIQIKKDKNEPKELTLAQIAAINAESFYKELKKPVIVEDTGVFFSAYKNFPGNSPKLAFEQLGYNGLLKLLDHEKRNAYFMTAACLRTKEGSFTSIGKLSGKISEEVFGKNLDVMPYERIFLYKKKPLCLMDRVEKNKISHRAKAFNKLGKYIMEL
ncbi:MAG: non-canonical purine NTP pyrophosphatase [archaeon]